MNFRISYKINLIAIFCCIQFLNTVNLSLAQEPEKLEFNTDYKIWVDKESYLIREPIWLSIYITNHGEIGPSITSNIISYFFVTDELGNKYRCNRRYIIDYDKVKHMSSGQIFTYRFDLEERYAYYDGVKRHSFNEGILTVQGFIRQSGYEDVLSNKLYIEIKKPKGHEKKVYDLLMKNYDIVHTKFNYSLGSKNYMSIVNNFPESVYAPLALNKSIQIGYGTLDKRKLLIEKYPRSYFAENQVYGLKQDFIMQKKNDEGRQYFQRIINTTNSEDLRRELEQYIIDFDRKFK